MVSSSGRLHRGATLLLGLSCLKVAEASADFLPTPPPTDYLAKTFELPNRKGSSGNLPVGLTSKAQCNAMVEDAVTWAALNGLLVRSAVDTEGVGSDEAPLYTHAPFSLLPATFPADELDQANRLAPLFGLLVDRVAQDVPWLSRTLRGAADGDDFTRRLLKLCAQVQREGATQHARLAILRSDYMLHEPDGAAGGRLLQVELNTIASSFGALAARVCALHTTLAQRWTDARQHVWLMAGRPSRLSLPSVLAPSPAIEKLAAAMAMAHEQYGVPEAAVLFVVQPDEANTIDQDTLALQLWSRHGLMVIRRSLAQIAHEGRLVGKERRLMLPGGVEVAVAYFRAGYTPADYPSSRQWDARTLIERSHAIKCPCVEHHLVGCKKVQQQLALPGELERFLSAEDAARLRVVFAGLWSLSGPMQPPTDAAADEHEAAHHMRMALERPADYVMKPQREGGGHNLFGDELVNGLSTLSQEQRAAYILMQRIQPRRAPAVLVRRGVATIGPAVSELGVYSTLLTSATGRVLLNEAAGHLVRTKLDGVDEGGVAAGYAVLSSPLAGASDGALR